ncbi:MAG: hypothetical protein EBT55_04865 [Proteobacteria bacterium]|nr:hypothetical protein [Pseudomonadota bacterium]
MTEALTLFSDKETTIELKIGYKDYLTAEQVLALTKLLLSTAKPKISSAWQMLNRPKSSSQFFAAEISADTARIGQDCG